jgi:hypothetical protein
MGRVGNTRGYGYRATRVSRRAVVRALVEIGRRQRVGPWPSTAGFSLADLYRRLGLSPTPDGGAKAPARARAP